MFPIRFLQQLAPALILGPFLLPFLSCNGAAPADEKNGSAHPDSTSTETEAKIAFQLNQQGDSVRSLSQYPAAIALYQRSMDSAAAHADSFLYYDSKLDLATVYDRLDELPKAIEIAEPVLYAYIRSGDTARIGRAYSTLSGFYGRAKQLDKQLATALKGYELLRTHGSLIERCAASNQMAFTYSENGKWEEALPLLDSALALMQASGVLDQLCGMYLNLGDCHRNLEHWDEARRYFTEAERLATESGQVHLRAVALKRLSQVAESTGNTAEALTLYRQSVAIKDSIFKADNAQKIREMEADYAMKEKEQEISLINARYRAEVNRRNLILVLVVALLGAMGLWWRWWRQKIRQSKLELERHQQALSEFARLLMIKNARLSELEEKQHEEASVAEKEAVAEPLDESADFQEGLYNSRILTDADWELFKNYFELGNPGFLFRLRANFPKLSSAEERLLLLLKLNFSSQEVAATLGISKEGVKKGRQRLRKRLGLRPEDDLEKIIQQI